MTDDELRQLVDQELKRLKPRPHMSANEMFVIADMVAAAKGLCDTDERRAIASRGMLKDLKTFAWSFQADENTLKGLNITRAQHERCLVEAYQELMRWLGRSPASSGSIQ